MFVRKSEAVPIEFEGLRIFDFTSDKALSSSFAMIEVPSGSEHAMARSKRSDKYYLVVDGSIKFTLESEEVDLDKGDFCFVRQGEKFGYRNTGAADALLVLAHTPSFDLESEVFIDAP